MKIIVDIKDDTPLHLAMECVQRVIKKGRTERKGKSYAHSIFERSDNRLIIVAVAANKKSDTFTVWGEPGAEQ